MTQTNVDISDIIAKWKPVKGSLVMMLHAIQGKCGYIPREKAMEVSEKTGIPLSKIYEVLTFYHFFKLTPPPQYQINVCTGTACYLKGAPEFLAELNKLIGIKEGETTKDGKYAIAGLRCLGCCGLAPVISINGKIYGQVKASQVKGILEGLDKGEKPA